MPESAIVHNTFVIEREYLKPPEQVFTAFANSAIKRRWFAEGEHHDVETFEMEFRVGGSERVVSRFKAGTPFPGVALIADGRFLKIELNRFIVQASTMALGEHCISASLISFEFVPIDSGTTLRFTHQAAFFEGADGPQIREDGWQKLLDRLTREFA